MKIYIYLFVIFFLNTPLVFAQDTSKEELDRDTLFFQYEKDYLKKGEHAKNEIYILDALKDQGSSEVFFFQIENILSNLEPKKTISLKSFIQNSKFYRPDKKKNTFDDSGLSKQLNKFIIFLEKPDCEAGTFFKVHSRTVMD